MKKSESTTVVKILFALYIALVLFLCFYNFSSEDIKLPKEFLGIPIDKYIHFIMFYPFSFICWMFFEYHTPENSSKRYHIYRDFRFTTIIILGIVLAAFTEAGQALLTTERACDPLDLLADFLAILAGSITVFFTRTYIKRAFNYIFRVKL